MATATTTQEIEMTTTANAQMTTLYTEEIPQIVHNEFDKPRHYPIIFKNGLWTAFVLSGPIGQRARFGYLVEIQRETLNDLEVVLHGSYATITNRLNRFQHNLVIAPHEEEFLKFIHPEHHALCELFINNGEVTEEVTA